MKLIILFILLACGQSGKETSSDPIAPREFYGDCAVISHGKGIYTFSCYPISLPDALPLFLEKHSDLKVVSVSDFGHGYMGNLVICESKDGGEYSL